MGDFRVTVVAIGGHGCQREIKNGGIVAGCGHAECPDCITRRYVEELRAKGSHLISATLEHWAHTEQKVSDDLLTGERKGGF